MAGSRDDSNFQSSTGARAVPISNSPPSPNCNDEDEKHKHVSTPQNTNKTANAFERIMSGSKNSSKKRRHSRITGSTNTKSRFVPCPVCGKHIIPHEMNKHLDACLLRQATKQQQQQQQHEEQKKSSSPLQLLDNNEPKNAHQIEECSFSITSTTPTEGTPLESVITSNPYSPIKTASETDQVIEKDKRDQDGSPLNATAERNIDNSNHKQNNVFAHMMERSVKVFSEQEAYSASLPKLLQQMHLHEDGTVSLTCYKNSGSMPAEGKIAWSARIQVRGKKEGATPPIDLFVSSSILSSTSGFASNEPARMRLVRNHSRLSVPVLKSILQKGIRRRKPLPSVRVASELADKSLGDLLRRLPIIVLEDSALHPSLPFLVWLMMAVSKDYQPPLSLLKKVLGIVFEMASCRWQDSLRLHKPQQTTSNSNESDVDREEHREFLTLSSLHKANGASRNSGHNDQWNQSGTAIVLNKDELLVWSILMRGQYGGMACDIQMLQGYAELWHERFTSARSLSNDEKNRLSPSIPPTSSCSPAGMQSGSPSTSTGRFGNTAGQKSSGDKQYLQEWIQVPAFIHESAAKHSACRIDRLVLAKSMVSPSQSQSQSQSQSSSSMQDKNHLQDGRSFVGLASLCKSDITLEGVDFHCSSVLESAILSDSKLVQECFDRLGDMKTSHRHSRPAADKDGRSFLEGLLKTCMWKYSGGVNFRLPMIATETNLDDSGLDVEDGDLRGFYDTLVRARVEAFSERYVNERLSIR